MARKERTIPSEFNKREVFHNQLGIVIDNLTRLEKVWRNQPTAPSAKHLDLELTKKYFLGDPHYGDVTKGPERMLFTGIFNLFSFKHQLTEADRTLSELKKEKKKGRVVGFLGPLGVGKSTLAKATAKELRKPLSTSEPHLENPFWKAQQDSPEKYDEFMLRSQIFFLLFNIQADIKSDTFSRIRAETFISDTSIFNDIYEFVEWYSEIGKFDKKEYQLYLRLVNLLKPIIPLPDTLVVVNADSVTNLLEGIRNRKKDTKARKGETKFTDKEMQIQMDLTNRVLEVLSEEWKVNTLILTVNPLRFNKNNIDERYLRQLVKLIKRRIKKS